jgi:hypothetical protein
MAAENGYQPLKALSALVRSIFKDLYWNKEGADAIPD